MCKYLIISFGKLLKLCLSPLFKACFAGSNQQGSCRCIDFVWGFVLGLMYYYCVLTRIPFPDYIGLSVAVFLSLLLGPITNMGRNAREVVRVFACSTQLSYNLSKEEHGIIATPFRKTALSVQKEMEQIKETLRSVKDIVSPIEYEVENEEEVYLKKVENDCVDKWLGTSELRSQCTEDKYQPLTLLRNESRPNCYYHKMYEKKLEYRCENQLTHAIAVCVKAFDLAYGQCLSVLGLYGSMVCWPLKLDYACNVLHIIGVNGSCNSTKQMDPGFEEGYLALERAKNELAIDKDDIKLQYKVYYERELHDIQDAKETGERVISAFEEKTTLMGTVAVALDMYVAFLYLRILAAAINYHDKYLTKIDFDNLYLTGYFKRLDERRGSKGQMTLLPLKKMERLKYTDLQLMSFREIEQSTLLAQILKVMLEMVTATTFVMLDRLFFEALDVVRQHAQIEVLQQNPRDVDIEVEGTGMLAALFRKLLSNISSQTFEDHAFTNEDCVPRPRPMPLYYYFNIYGGYLGILLLLYINPYTLRLSRLNCSYFYPRREKQRVLHLYNDILKKRMKMQKTLRRKAVQAVRAHYLSGENLLSLRVKFPQIFGWLQMFPAARMTCLICGETEPRTVKYEQEQWHACRVPNCPFLFCDECWHEAGGRCLACDPSLVELSDIDSLSEDDHPKY